MQNKTFSVTTLGCRTNQYESQAYIDQLQGMGYSQVKEGSEAAVCVVNTCTVTDAADQSSKHAVRHLLKQHPHARVVVTGCAAERNRAYFESLPGVHQVIGNADKEKLLPLAFPEVIWPEFSITHFEAHTRAFVKVQDGCNSFCTYCVIPYVRGRSRSRKVDDIIREIHNLVANGFQEIVLTGINIGDFDGNPDPGEEPVRLATLVRIVGAIPGITRLRLSSIDPDEVDEDLIDALMTTKTACPSLHIVLQSGSNVVLKRMNRKYTSQMFIDAVEKMRHARHDFTFTTDVIVGFPGESEKDFQDTLDMLTKVRFAKVHMFPYSPREKTRAALFPDQVAPQVMKQRKRQVLELAEKTSFSLREEFLGQEVDVLLESLDSNPLYFSGHTIHFLRVLVPAENLFSNQVVKVRLVKNTPYALEGALV